MSLPEQKIMLYQKKAIFAVCVRPNRTNAVYLWPAFSAMMSAFSASLFALFLVVVRVVSISNAIIVRKTQLKVTKHINISTFLYKQLRSNLKSTQSKTYQKTIKFLKHHRRQHYREQDSLFLA